MGIGSIVSPRPFAAAARPFDVDGALSRVRASIRAELGDDVHDSWFGGLRLEGFDGETATFSVPTRFLRSWIENRYLRPLTAAARGSMDAARVDVTVRSTARPRPATVPSGLPPVGLREDGPPSPPAATEPFAGSNVDPRRSFETFAVGPSNEAAFCAVRSLVDDERAGGVVYLYGEPGLGKTHLLQSLASTAGVKCLYMTAERFMYGFVVALQSKTLDEFKARTRSVDLLVVDDVQFMQGAAVLAEFRRALRVMSETGGTVVLAGDRPHGDLGRLDPESAERIGKGRSYRIEKPDRDLRASMVAAKVNEARSKVPGFEASREVIDYVSDAIGTNGRDIEGAVNRLVARFGLFEGGLTVEGAKLAIGDMVRTREPRKVKVEDIQRLVAQHFKVTREDILSTRRTADVVWPRQVAMYVSKVTTPNSLPEIGRRFGGRDHTTVLHAVRKVGARIAGDARAADEIGLLIRMLTE